jgi:hypothetical protein
MRRQDALNIRCTKPWNGVIAIGRVRDFSKSLTVQGMIPFRIRQFYECFKLVPHVSAETMRCQSQTLYWGGTQGHCNRNKALIVSKFSALLSTEIVNEKEGVR